MDPRPYTYEYRKPRLNNPTYHSQHLYDSIYHMPSFTTGRRFAHSERVDKIHNSPPRPQLHYQMPPPERQNQLQQMIQPRLNHQPKYETISYPQEPKLLYEREPPTYKPQHNNRQVRNEQIEAYNPQPQHVGSYPSKNLDEQSKSSRGGPIRSYSQETNKYSNQNSFSSYGQHLMRPIPGKDQDRIYQKQQKAFNIINCYPRQYPNVHRKYPKLTLEHKLLEQNLYNPEYN